MKCTIQLTKKRNFKNNNIKSPEFSYTFSTTKHCIYLRESSQKQNPIWKRFGPWQLDSTGDIFDGLQHDLRYRWRFLSCGNWSWNPKCTNFSTTHRANMLVLQSPRRWRAQKLWPKRDETDRFGFLGFGIVVKDLGGLSSTTDFAHLSHFL